jgi:signal transduction histidine kinase
MSRIIADLLDLSRLESGSEMDDQVRLDTVAADEVERMGDAAGLRGVSISVEVAPVPAVRGSARDLSLMVRNLIDNAVRYTGDGGSVDVSVRAEPGRVVIRVADTGIGIPQRELPRIFERFYRVDRARSRETGGTGLGLSIVRHVTENHGGEVGAESELGQGTVFEVRLPTAPAAP